MKVIVVFAVVLGAALAQGPGFLVPGLQAGSDGAATVLRSESDNAGLDGYNYAYETSNGISAQESAQLQNAGSENEAIVARGSYSYTGSDGNVYSVQYVADENGFQPQGAHLPKP